MAKLTPKEALLKKPHQLGQLEPELRSLPPRNKDWRDNEGKKLYESALEMAYNWLAVRGWVAQIKVTQDHEGPDYYITVAYELKGSVYVHSFKAGYDLYHWGGDHREWFEATIKEGLPLTLLVNPQDPNKCCVFGQLDAYVADPSGNRWMAK